MKKYMSLESQNFSNELYKCDPCKTSFGSEVKWARHMQRHKGEPGKLLNSLTSGVNLPVDFMS